MNIILYIYIYMYSFYIFIFIVQYFLVIGICAVSIMVIVQFSMFKFNLVMNATQHDMNFVTEYFVDEEKYFFLILLHMSIAVCIGLTAILATGIMFIAYFKFICGMFQISR